MYQTKKIKCNAVKVTNKDLLPQWVKLLADKTWGPGAIKLSQDKRGFAIALWNNGRKDYISQGDYLVDWFGTPTKMEAKQFEELFDGATKDDDTNTARVRQPRKRSDS